MVLKIVLKPNLFAMVATRKIQIANPKYLFTKLPLNFKLKSTLKFHIPKVIKIITNSTKFTVAFILSYVNKIIYLYKLLVSLLGKRNDISDGILYLRFGEILWSKKIL